jgi:glycerol uptake facilitator-like aquaporin
MAPPARRRLVVVLLLAVAGLLLAPGADGIGGQEQAEGAQHATADAVASAVAALAAADPSGALRAAVLRELGGGETPPPLPPPQNPPQARRHLLAAPPPQEQQPPWRAPKYPLHVRALSEFLGMCFTILVGECALANELLPSTKGHGYGFFPVVWTFGFTFFVWLQVFGGVSAKLNPAMCLAQWIAGIITGGDFVVLSLAEFAGAFVGAVGVWVYYLPHFKSLPEPPSLAPEDDLLRRRDVMQQNALQIASYNTRPERAVGGRGVGGGGPFGGGGGGNAAGAPGSPGAGGKPGGGGGGKAAVMNALGDFVYYLKPGVHLPRLEDELAGAGGGSPERDPWRDEEAAAVAATMGGGGAVGGGGGFVPVTAHQLADRYFQHDDQVERRRRENSNEALANMAAASSRGASVSPGGAGAAAAAAAGGSGNLAAASAPQRPASAAALPPLPPAKDLRRRSIQVADLHRHLADLHVAEVRRRVALARGGTIPPRPPPLLPPPSQPLPSAAAADGARAPDANNTSATNSNTTSPAAKSTGFALLPRLAGGLRPSSSAGAVGGGASAGEHPPPPPAAPSSSGIGGASDDGSNKHGRHHHHHHHHHHNYSHPHLPHVGPVPNLPPLDPAREAYARECAAAWALLSDEERRAHRLYEAALEADRNAKLSIFATRPAIMSPLWNLIAEGIGTFMLILGALMIELVPDVFLPPELRPLYVRGLQAFLIGVMVVVFISSLGGPTGYAANPARDFGPRFAHFVLPISNKGVSEWLPYGWVPVLGPFAGGAAAGGAYHALRLLFVHGAIGGAVA